MTERFTPREQFIPRPTEAAERKRIPTEIVPTSPDNSHDIVSLQGKVESHAVATNEFPTPHTPEDASGSHSIGLHASLKSEAYRHTLTQVRSRLRTPQRAFSHVIHAKPVERVSAAAETTIGRAYGILGGATCALIGTAYMLYAARTSGFSYNYIWLIVLFAVGYTATTLTELLIRTLKR